MAIISTSPRPHPPLPPAEPADRAGDLSPAHPPAGDLEAGMAAAAPHHAAGGNTVRSRIHRLWQSQQEIGRRLGEWRDVIERSFGDHFGTRHSQPKFDIPPGTFSWRRFGRKVAQNCGREAFVAGSALLCGHLAQMGLSGTSFTAEEDTPLTVPSTNTVMPYRKMYALSAFFGVAMYSRPVFEKLADSFGQARLRGPARLKAVYEVRQKHWITEAELAKKPDYIADAIRKLDAEIPKRIEQAKNATGNVRDQLLTLAECMMRWQDQFLLHRPDERKPVEKWMTREGRMQLHAQMRDRLGKVEDLRLKNKLLSYLTRIATRSVEVVLPEGQVHAGAGAEDDGDWHRWTSVPRIPALNIHLLGAEGAGKSSFVKTIEDLLGLPVASLTVPPLMKGGMEEVYAKTWDATNQVKYITNDPDLLGKLGLILIKLACENGVLNIDEPNWEDVAGIKRLLDPWRETVEAAALNTAFKWSTVTRIVTSNDVPEETERRTAESIVGNMNGAVHDRLDVALFPEASWAEKRDAAVRAYRDIASLFCLPLKDGDGPVLIPAQQAEMQRAFRAVLDKLVDWHHAKNAGMRMHIPVEYVMHRIYDRLQEQALARPDGASNPRLNDADVLQDVTDYYEPQPDKNPYARGTDRLQKAMGERAPDAEPKIADAHDSIDELA